MHTSVESFVRQQIKKFKITCPDSILSKLEEKEPTLYENFKPQVYQLTYFIAINNKDLAHDTPNGKRQTRSSKMPTPVGKAPLPLESVSKKRESKEQQKQTPQGKKLEKIVQNISTVPAEEQTDKKEEAPLEVISDVQMAIEEPVVTENLASDKSDTKKPSPK